MRRLSIVIAVLVLVASLAACGNYAGNGNDFVVRATVTESSHDAVRIKDVKVESTTGEANGWFDDNGGWFEQDHLVLHNNFHDGRSIWVPKTYVGQAYDANHQKIELEDVKVGAHIKAVGKIRSDKRGKSFSSRAVFGQLYVVS